ncbi:hypothetical protein PFISCL1PPCAC_26940, partial [Pristionchus fissidentatus]
IFATVGTHERLHRKLNFVSEKGEVKSVGEDTMNEGYSYLDLEIFDAGTEDTLNGSSRYAVWSIIFILIVVVY